MAGGRVPAALRDRLGDEATFGLIELLDAERQEWREQVLSVAADRFERRLTEEIAGLRVEFRTVLQDDLAAVRSEMHDGFNSLRQEMHSGGDSLRQEMHSGGDSLRQQMHDLVNSLRQEMHSGGDSLRQQMHDLVNSLRQEMHSGGNSLRQQMHDLVNSLRQDIATTRVELLKWSFLFWVGQIAAMAGLFAMMYRMGR